MWHAEHMALFRKRKPKTPWVWDPAAANVNGEQAWALLTNAIYFQSAARRLDTLGGGLEGLDWVEGLASWWDVRDEREFDELVEWMQDGGYRVQWAERGVDDGELKLAWDYCRLITVSGGAALAQVIEADKAWELVLRAGDKLGSHFDSWHALGQNYLSGRILWLEDHGQWSPDPDPSQALFQDVADQLGTDPDSPWNRVSWDRSAGVIVDGAPVN